MSDRVRELYSLEAEHGVLGAVMLASLQGDPEIVEGVLAALRPADFEFDDNAALFQAISDCHASQMPVDAVTVGITLRTLPSGENTLVYASEITDKVPSTANWKAYAQHLRNLSALRQVVAAGAAVQSMAVGDGSLEDVIASAQQAMADLRDLSCAEPDVVRIGEVIPAVVDGVDAGLNGRKERYLSTGLPDLDKLFNGGLRPRTMVVIAGRPGSGKTMLGLQIAQHVAVSRAGVGLVFSLEMTKEELTTRSLAAAGGVSLTRLDDGSQMEDEDWPKLTAAVGLLADAQLYLCDRVGMTVARIRAECLSVQRKHGLNVVVIDYLGLIPGEGPNRTERIATISTAMKNLAKEIGVPILVLAQLNRDSTKRAGKAKKPQSSELRDSGQIEQDADMVLLVHRDMDTEEGQSGVTELILDKGRQARVGSCFVRQQGNFARFVPLDAAREPSQEEVEMSRPFSTKYSGGGRRV